MFPSLYLSQIADGRHYSSTVSLLDDVVLRLIRAVMDEIAP